LASFGLDGLRRDWYTDDCRSGSKAGIDSPKRRDFYIREEALSGE